MQASGCESKATTVDIHAAATGSNLSTSQTQGSVGLHLAVYTRATSRVRTIQTAHSQSLVDIVERQLQRSPTRDVYITINIIEIRAIESWRQQLLERHQARVNSNECITSKHQDPWLLHAIVR